MTLLCEICGPENDCTCGPCPCKWCRYSRGERLDPMELAQVKAHIRAMKAYDERKAAEATIDKIRSRWGA